MVLQLPVAAEVAVGLFLSNLQVVFRLPYKYKNHVLIWDFFQPETEFYCQKRFWTHFDQVSKIEANKK